MVSGAQIALRFPQWDGPGVPTEAEQRQAAAEGSGWHTDGLRQGRMHPFSVLYGVCLSECMQPWQGNLLVWPGSHRLIHSCLVGPHGAIDFPRLRSLLAGTCAGAETVASAAVEEEVDAEEENAKHDNEPADLPLLGTAVPVMLRPGDIVLAHPDLAHTGGPNFGSHIRSMVYFRVKSGVDPEEWQATVHRHKGDMWRDFGPEVRAAAERYQYQ